MLTELCFVTGPNNITAIFKSSRSFAVKASVVIAMDRLFGTPKHIVSFYDADNSGFQTTPHPWSNVEPNNRIHHIVHTQVVKHLCGSALKSMSNRLMDNVGKIVFACGIGYEWLDMPDLFEFCQVKLLHVSLDTMFGLYLTVLNSEFVSEYWKFDECILNLIKGLRRFLSSQSWKARDKCLESLKRYHEYVSRLYDADGCKDYQGLDPFFGTEFIRQRNEAFFKMTPMNADAMASEHLAIMWAYVCSVSHVVLKSSC